MTLYIECNLNLWAITDFAHRILSLAIYSLTPSERQHLFIFK